LGSGPENTAGGKEGSHWQRLEATAEEAAFFSQAANHPLTAHLAQ
jgi:hypothetical protein